MSDCKAKSPVIGGKQIACYLLSAVGRRNVLILFAIVCIMSVIDMVGIAVIFPFLQVVMQPEAIEKFTRLLDIEITERLSHQQLIVLIGVGLILLYAGKTCFQLLLIKIQARTLARFTEEMTNNTVFQILNARYAIFQELAASRISGMAYSNTVHATLAFAALIQIFNEGFLLAILLIASFIYQPVLALGAISIAALTGVFLYQIVIRRSAELGSAQSQIENVRYRLLFSIATAIRDIKIMGLDRLFDMSNRRVSHEYAELAWRYNYNISFPRFLIEFMALLSIVAGALAVVLLNISLKEAGPLLGMVTLATLRVIPAFSRLFSGISTFRSSSPFVKDLMELRLKLAAGAVSRLNDNLVFNKEIELRNIGFHYGKKQILRDVSLHLKRGESIGIVGTSGAGKTTLLDLFTGLQPATAGQFFCDGVEFDPFGSKGIQKLIGYVPQVITLLDETIAFNVSFEEKPNRKQVMRALGMANLHELIESLPEGTQTRVGENGLRLSGGQRQRIGIARALYRSPEILVFDEATSSLDALSEKELSIEIEKLRGQISSVIVAHRLSTVMACNRIYVLSNGVVENCGTHAELLFTSKIYKKLYSTQGEASGD